MTNFRCKTMVSTGCMLKHNKHAFLDVESKKEILLTVNSSIK